MNIFAASLRDFREQAYDDTCLPFVDVAIYINSVMYIYMPKDMPIPSSTPNPPCPWCFKNKEQSL